MLNRKFHIKKARQSLLYSRSQSYMQLKATIVAIAVVGMTAVTVPAFALVQPAFARESILLVKRTLQGGNSQAPDTKLNDVLREIAKLEIERAMLETRYASYHPSVVTISEEIEELRKIAAEIQPENSNVVINRAVSNVLVDKVAALEVKRALLEADHSPLGEVVKSAESQILGLRRRIAQIEPQNPNSKIIPAVCNALETKITNLNDERNRLKIQYTADDIGELMNIDFQLYSLQKRLAFFNSRG
jgi:chromosome segregation ATPase